MLLGVCIWEEKGKLEGEVLRQKRSPEGQQVPHTWERLLGWLAQTISQSRPPPWCPQEDNGQSLLDACPYLAGSMVPPLKTLLPKLIFGQPSSEAQGVG